MSDISFDFSARDDWLMNQAKANGIVIPQVAMHVCRSVGFNFMLTCAVLERESRGGRNIYGGDEGAAFEGHHNMVVTQQNYHDYLVERNKTGKGNGVGPMQLTFIPLQDEADFIGGCWNPYCNTLTGVNFLDKQLQAIDAATPNLPTDKRYWALFEAWNGPKYADDITTINIPKWQTILANPH